MHKDSILPNDKMLKMSNLVASRKVLYECSRELTFFV